MGRERDAAADAIVEWLASSPVSQRDKLATVRQQHVATIRALPDDDHALMIRTLKKRINSKRLADELAATLVELMRDRAPNPRAGVAASEPAPLAASYGSRREELEAAIAVDPDAQAPYLPYGDWLESTGDAFGPLVAMDRELAKNPGHKSVKRAREEYLRANQGALLGRLAGCTDMVTEIEWHMGFIRKCRLIRPHKRGQSLPDEHFADVLGWLLDDPGPGRFLQELHLLFEPKRERPSTLAIAARPRPTLRRLQLDAGELEGITELLGALPNLRELEVSSTPVEPRALEVAARALPKLEILSLTALDPNQVRALSGGTWPSLVSLSVGNEEDESDPAAQPADFAPLFDGVHAPRLKHLSLTGIHGGDELCERLAPSPLFGQLEKLDLSRGTVGDRGAIALLAHREALARIAFSAEDNYLGRAICEQLEAVAREANLHGQNDDGGDPASRFVGGYE